VLFTCQFGPKTKLLMFLKYLFPIMHAKKQLRKQTKALKRDLATKDY